MAMASISTSTPLGSARTSTTARAGGAIREKGGIHFVEFGELGHVGQENGDFHNLVQRTPAFLCDHLEVFQDLLGLLANGSFHDFPRMGVDGHLPGNEKQLSCGDRDGIRANRLWGRWGFKRLLLHVASSLKLKTRNSFSKLYHTGRIAGIHPSVTFFPDTAEEESAPFPRKRKRQVRQKKVREYNE